jgi:hypothetical protein
LKVIAASERRISWSCGRSDTSKGSRTPPSHCDTGTLGVRLIFPDCSNGKIDSDDHRSHMAYSRPQDGKRRCPRSPRLPVSQLTINANFTIGKTPGEVTISCDQGSCAPSSMHADFFNAWDPEALQSLVVNCINGVPPSKPRSAECQAPPA